MVPQSKAGDVQVEQETSSPSEDDLPVFGKQILEENEDSESIPRDSSLKRAQFPADYAEDEEQYSDGVETYFRDDEDMEKVEPQPEDTHPTHPDTTDEPSTQARSIPHPILTPTLTEEEKIALKKSDPLKYVDLMMALRDSSLDKSASGTSTQSGASASEASYDELLQQVKEAVFEADLFEVLKTDVTARFGVKKLINRINITACPANVGEVLIDIQNLIDQICTEYNREVDATSKLQAKEQEQTAEFDKAQSASKASKDLLASRKAAQAEFDTYTASITLWESHIVELQKKIVDARAKQTAIKGLDTTEADTLAAQSVEHVERASAMTEDIVRLKSIHAAVQYKLGLAKIKYERMKKNIPF